MYVFDCKSQWEEQKKTYTTSYSCPFCIGLPIHEIFVIVTFACWYRFPQLIVFIKNIKLFCACQQQKNKRTTRVSIFFSSLIILICMWRGFSNFFLTRLRQNVLNGRTGTKHTTLNLTFQPHTGLGNSLY